MASGSLGARCRSDSPAVLSTTGGGSRNFSAFIYLFDGVFVLDVDEDTLVRRLDERPNDEFGARPPERAVIMRLHRTGEDVPSGIRVDATRPLSQVVDDVLRLAFSG